MRLLRTSLLFFSVILSLLACNSTTKNESTDWCDQTLRVQFETLSEINTESNWFKVYKVGDQVYAIAEPYNFQEVISYLILGTERALLFDSGMGLSSIASLVKELTSLPVTVINSHTHYDHIGGNYEFEHILAMNTSFTKGRSVKGLLHDFVKHEIAKDAFCKDKLPLLDTTTYHIKPFPITEYIADGSTIDLGNRKLEIIAVPGHTPDAITLWDKKNGYLWTGDTFYEGPIWLFDEGTDLDAYAKSTQRLAQLFPDTQKVFPAHNIPVADPIRLKELEKAFQEVINGIKKPKTVGKNDTSTIFEFEHFSFMIRTNLLPSEK